MQIKNIQEQIKAHHALGHNLEAFLAQSAFIEGLFRELIDLVHFAGIHNKHLSPGKQQLDQIELWGKRLLQELYQITKKDNIGKLIELANKIGLLEEGDIKEFKQYIDQRNIIVHNLITEVQRDQEKESKESFDEILIKTYSLGEKLLSKSSMQEMLSSIKAIEKEKDVKTIVKEPPKQPTL